MKIMKTTLLFIATLFFLATPLIFSAGNAQAYVGDLQCLKCHEPVSHPGSADKVSYLWTGHKNMLRPYTGNELLNGFGEHYTEPGLDPATHLAGGLIDWVNGLWTDSAGATGSIQYVFAGYYKEGSPYVLTNISSSYCGIACHTTGAGLPGNSVGTVTETWALNGIQCERCHGEATFDENAVTDGSTVLDASYLKYRQSFPGTAADCDANGDGDCCDHGETGAEVVYYSNNYVSQLDMNVNGMVYPGVADATFYDIDGNVVTPAATIADGGTACDHPRPRGVHHGGTFNSVTGAAVSVPEGAEATALCYECHEGSHHDFGFLRSPHAKYTGDMTEASIANPANYASHFQNHDGGGCVVCHDVHVTTIDGLDAKAIKERCGINCHNPASGYTPVGGFYGFHDGLVSAGTMPSTISTQNICSDSAYDNQTDCEANGAEWIQVGDTGANNKACETCHMPDGMHYFDNDIAKGYTNTTYPGTLVPGELFAANDQNAICLQCHGADGIAAGKASVKFNEPMAPGAVESALSFNGGYHGSTTIGSVTDECTDCHADKSTFANTGHANTARLVPGDFDITGPDGATLECGHDGFYNVADGKCYPDLTFTPGTEISTPIFFHHSWFEPVDEDGTMVSAARPIANGDEFTCVPCHTTGFQTVPPTGSRYPLAGWNLTFNNSTGTGREYSRYIASWPAQYGDEASTDASWDEFGVQCERCHGDNSSGNHDAYAPRTAPETNALCGECHLQAHHTSSFLNGPHGGFTFSTTPPATQATLAEIADPNNYDPDNHFASNYNGCAGCHNVHATTIEAAGGGIAAFNKQCGLDCHGQDPSTDSHAKPLAWINHPTGPGTPLYNVTADNPQPACVTCHMPGSYRTDHLFEISVDPSYTRPGDAVPGAGRMYLTLDEVCGQCHNGVTAQDIPADLLANAAAVMHGTPVANTVSFTWWNDSSNEGTVNFVASGSSCPSGMACTYTWDFGDGSTGTGVTVSHKYSKNSSGTYDPVTATLDMGSLGSSAQVVTPTDPHSGPSCVDNSSFSVTVSGMDASLTDGTTAGSDASPAVYVDWGDGSPMSVGALKGSFNHTYIWPNSVVGYKVTEIVQDGMGFNCVNKTYVKIGNAVVGANEVTINAGGTGSAWKTSDQCNGYQDPAPCCTGDGTGTCELNPNLPVPQITYYVKDADGLTKATGSVALGGSASTGSVLPSDLTGYTVTFYYPTGHTCTPTTSAAPGVTASMSHGTAPVVGGSASVSDCF